MRAFFIKFFKNSNFYLELLGPKNRKINVSNLKNDFRPCQILQSFNWYLKPGVALVLWFPLF